MGADVGGYYHYYVLALGERKRIIRAEEGEIAVYICVSWCFASRTVLVCGTDGLEQDRDGGCVEGVAV